jgi:hypothetical protein
MRIELFDRRHRLAGHPAEGADLSFQGERLSRVAPVLQGVPVAPRSAATGPWDRDVPRRLDSGRQTNLGLPCRANLAEPELLGRQDAPVPRYDAIMLVQQDRNRPAPLFNGGNLIYLGRRMSPRIFGVGDQRCDGSTLDFVCRPFVHCRLTATRFHPFT